MVLISLHHHFTQGHSLEALVAPRTIQAFQTGWAKKFSTDQDPLCQRKCLLGWNVFFVLFMHSWNGQFPWVKRDTRFAPVWMALTKAMPQD